MAQQSKARVETCWITWERHQRSRSLSAQLHIPLVELARSGGRIARYVRESLATFKELAKRRPRVVFVQVPSLVLGHVVLALRSLLRFRVVVDAHNAVIEGAERADQPLRSLYRSMVKRADLIIVTNSSLANRVRRLGGTPGILPDPVPEFRRDRAIPVKPSSVVVISTWAEDEPIEEIIHAANQLPEPLRVTITGRPKGPHQQLASRSSKIRLSGFVNDRDYIEMLTTASVIVDLTTRDDCLVCGAYEALALGRPLVVSDSQALRELLKDGANYSRNDAAQIAKAISETAASENEWTQRCEARRESYIDEWRAAAARLLSQVESVR
jgi:glycosyltransferase involved in cell wall biosynthesis